MSSSPTPENRSERVPKSQNSPNSTAVQKVSIWTYKPWWCQPWSILSTGFGAIALSWLVLHRYWVTGLVAVPMLTWMGFFLLLFPKLAAESGLLAEMQREYSQAKPSPPSETSGA